MTSIQLALEVGDESSAYLVTAAQALNSPELLSAMWETAFDSAPLRDQNGDSHPDWALRGGGFFNAGSLDAGGFWNADATLDTYPDNDFHTLTTAEVRLRSTSVGAAGAVSESTPTGAAHHVHQLSYVCSFKPITHRSRPSLIWSIA